MKTARLLCAFPLFVPVALVGCGGFGPGDYQLYRVAAAEPQLSGDCAADDDGDSNTIRDGSTVMLFFSGGEAEGVFLDIGSAVLEGAETEDGYTFDGRTTDNTDDGDTVFTIKTDITVDVTFDGDTVNLTSNTKVQSTCSGECDGFTPTTCNISGSAVGVAVNESVSVPLDGDQANP
ncbi:MAG: hypothetical protein JNK04_05295 [Myxococcales bacterium]|nr:hypothetical protein [Myxococcales bacterium]